MTISVGDHVVIVDLPSGMTAGLPDEEAQFVAETVGREAEVSDLLSDGLIELTIEDSSTGVIHFIVLPEGMVTKVDTTR